jgi:hypothetical protein
MGRSAHADTLDLRLQLGVEHCRVGNWEAGLAVLSGVFSEGTPTGSEAAVAASYLGYASALLKREIGDGLALCQKVADKEFYQAEVHYNLARTLLLAGHKSRSVRALERALVIDPSFVAAFELRCELGERRRPVLPFLARGNLLNRLLGRIRTVFAS